MSTARICNNCGKEITPTRFVISFPVAPISENEKYRKGLNGQVQLNYSNGRTLDFCNHDCLRIFVHQHKGD